MKIHRTFVVRYLLSKLSEEERNAVLKLMPRLDALGNLFARGYVVEPPDIPRRFIHEFRYFQEELAFSTPPKRWLARVHPLLNCQIRLDGEKDRSEGIFIDLSKGALKVRGFVHRRAIEIPLPKSVAKYIGERVEEGAKAKLARVWTDGRHLYVAITFEREVEVRQDVTVMLAVDVNSWRNGVSWGLIKGGKIVSRGVERPNLHYIESLHNEIVVIERRLGKLERLGLRGSREYDELWERAKIKRSKFYRYLRDFVNKLVHRLIKKAVKHGAKIVIDDVIEESRRELLEERLPDGLAKLYLVYVRRFVDLLVNQARWYGLPVEFKRLPSTVCPACGARLEQRENRVMVCPHCGFKANRDEVPIQWAIKMYYTRGGAESRQVGYRWPESQGCGPAGQVLLSAGA